MAHRFSTGIVRIKLQGEGALPHDNTQRLLITKALVGGKEVDVALLPRWNGTNNGFKLTLLSVGGANGSVQATNYSSGGTKVHWVSTNYVIDMPDVLPHVFTSCGHIVLKVKFGIQWQSIPQWCDNMAAWIRDSGPGYQRLASPDCDQCGAFISSGFPDFCRSGLNLRCFMNGPLMKDQETNFELHVDDVTFYTHKIILMSESVVFQGMIINKFAEKMTGTATIKDCTPENMRAFLTVYYDRVKFEDYQKDCGKVGGVFELASKYLVEDIKQRCLKAFRTVPIEPEGFCDLIRIADIHAPPGLMERCAQESGKLPDGFWREESTIAFIHAYPKAFAAYTEILVKRATV